MTDPKPYPKIDYGRNVNAPDVLIIGAGIAGMRDGSIQQLVFFLYEAAADDRFRLGMCTAIDMIKSGSGRNFIIVEKGNQVGGTWNDNTYPGCCCDGMTIIR